MEIIILFVFLVGISIVLTRLCKLHGKSRLINGGIPGVIPPSSSELVEQSLPNDMVDIPEHFSDISCNNDVKSVSAKTSYNRQMMPCNKKN